MYLYLLDVLLGLRLEVVVNIDCVLKSCFEWTLLTPLFEEVDELIEWNIHSYSKCCDEFLVLNLEEEKNFLSQTCLGC